MIYAAIGIDPGPETSTIVRAFYDPSTEHWLCGNCIEVPTADSAPEWLHSSPVFIERIVAQGMKVTQPTFTTALNAGALAQYFYSRDRPVYLVKRSAVLRLIVDPGVKKSNTDTDCRRGLVRVFGEQKKDWPLKGTGTHGWAALAMAYYGLRIQKAPWLAKGLDAITYTPPFEAFIPEKA